MQILVLILTLLITIVGQLRVMCSVGTTTNCSKKKQTDRVRTRTTLRLYGYVVCEETFCFANGFSSSRFKRLKKRFILDGVIEPVHKLVGKAASINVSDKCIKDVISFLQCYATENALFLPGGQAT